MPSIHYYTAQAVRELDRLAIEEHGVPGFTLMQRAAHAAWEALRQRWPDVRHLIVCCGTGNNGGDGFVLAALARAAGLEADIFLAGSLAQVKGDAAKAVAMAQANKVVIHENAQFPKQLLHEDTVIVDALLGTGLNGEVRPSFRAFIDAINASGLPVLAVDIPSGLCSDTGTVLGACVNAALTVTFIGRKLGLIRQDGPAHTGTLVFDDLQVPAAIYRQVAPALTVESP